ncbi:M23 family metallopeptidase [Streptomyces sp. NPDC101132]|uniref:M23 family metallopeptidase n=1 Tax=Streptomyces sp. NPDC101132 TaxID=3366110 RepID=UPI0037F39C86
MSKSAATHRVRQSAFRTRSTVVAAGLGALMVFGAGHAAFAAGTTDVSTALSAPAQLVSEQAAAQAKAAQQASKTAAQAKAAAKAAAAKKAAGWTNPVENYVVSATYGKGGSMWARKHSGQDFAVPTGTPVKAVHKGVVVKAGPNGAGDGPAYGNAIVIKHANNTYSQYAHLSKVQVRVGQTVSTDQRIGLSGNTGNSSGPHLHFEIRTTPNYGSAINPVTFLAKAGVKI